MINIRSYINFEGEYFDASCAPVVEDIFDLIHKSDFEAVQAKVIKGNVDINYRNDKGQTLLHYALLYNQIKIAKFLISQRAKLEVEDNKDLVWEKYLYVVDNSLPSLILPISNEKLIEDDQLQQSGEVEDCCCIIS